MDHGRCKTSRELTTGGGVAECLDPAMAARNGGRPHIGFCATHCPSYTGAPIINAPVFAIPTDYNPKTTALRGCCDPPIIKEGT